MASKRSSILILFVVISLSMALTNWHLYSKNKDLRSRTEALSRLLEPQTNMFVPPLVGTDAQGNSVTIESSSPGKETLLLVFSQTCPHCQKNFPLWRELLLQLDRETYHVALVNLGQKVDADQLARDGMDGIPLVNEVSSDSILKYRLRFTPQTILIGSDQRVKDVFSGPLNGTRADRIRDVLGVDPAGKGDRP